MAQEFRKAMIAMILATDMTVHFDYLDRFTKRFASPDAELAKKPFTEEEQNFGVRAPGRGRALHVPRSSLCCLAETEERVAFWAGRPVAGCVARGREAHTQFYRAVRAQLAMLLHCADISNPAKPKNTYFDWTDRVRLAAPTNRCAAPRLRRRR
jgi:hypothetical protein